MINCSSRAVLQDAVNATYDGYLSIYFVPLKFWSFIVFTVIAVTGGITNCFLLLVMFKDPLKCFGDPMSSFIVNVAITDLLSVVLYLEEVILWQTPYVGVLCLPHWLSVVNLGVYEYLLTVTVSAVFGLSFERYISIVRPLWHKVNVTPRVCRVSVACLWLTSAIWSIVALTLDNIGYFNTFKILINSSYLFFLVPTMVCYLCSCISVRRQSRALKNGTSVSCTTRRVVEARLKNQNNFLLTIFVVSIGLSIGWVPTIVALFASEEDDFQPPFSTGLYIVFSVSDILLLINHSINPFVYLWRLPKYKRAWIALYCAK